MNRQPYAYQHTLTPAEIAYKRKNFWGGAIVLTFFLAVLLTCIIALVLGLSGAVPMGFDGGAGQCDTQTPTCNG